MKNKVLLFGLVLLFCSHDMYLKLDSYFLQPNTDEQILLFNGTFDASENVIDRDRMVDASLLGNGQRITITENQWSEKDSITYLNFKTGSAGTWVAGVSTKARNIEMEAEAFNNYLEHDGVKDMLESRRKNDLLEEDAIEKYSKHVKVIFQVGDATSNDWSKPLGYPIEFIPQENPYNVHTGDSIVIKLLRDGKPLTNQLVYADYKPSKNGHTHDDQTKMHSHDGGEPHSHSDDMHDHKDTTEDHEHTHKHGDDEHSHGHSHDDNDHDHEHASGTTKSHEHTHKHSNKEEHSHDHEHDASATKNHEHEHDDKAKSHEHTHKHGNKEEHSHDHKHDANATENHEHEHDNIDIEQLDHSTKPHTHNTGQEIRTNEKGEVTVQLKADGIWYLRTIHLMNSEEAGPTHESNWATLTFEVSHDHRDNKDHDHHDHDSEGIPMWIFIAASIVVIGGLFFIFNRKK